MTRLFPSACAYCGYEHDRTSQVTKAGGQRGEEAEIQPGDVTLCINCGRMNVLGQDYSLRRPSKAEAREMATNPLVEAVLKAWEELKTTRQ